MENDNESVASSLEYEDLAPSLPPEDTWSSASGEASPLAMAFDYGLEDVPTFPSLDGDAHPRAESSNPLDMDDSPRAGASQEPIVGLFNEDPDALPHPTIDLQDASVAAPVEDIADKIPGLYRILDLVSEQSSGGGGLGERIEPISPDVPLNCS